MVPVEPARLSLIRQLCSGETSYEGGCKSFYSRIELGSAGSVKRNKLLSGTSYYREIESAALYDIQSHKY